LDYAKVGLDLFFQRIVIYSAAMVLAGAYYSWVIAFAFYAFVLVCELYDTYVFRKIIGRQVWEQADVRRAMIEVCVGTILSSAAISLFAISFALQQSPESGHFMPVFMLVSASIFAAMNNHHFLHILVIRLLIYVLAIIAIPVYDVWSTFAPISSEVWLHLFTVLFVLGFLFELARSFLAGYSKSLQSRLDLEREHEQTKAAYKAKTEFLSTVSHELRTPLTSIKGPLAFINSGALGKVPEKMRLPLEIAGRNAKRLEDLVEDLLLLQRADAGKLDLNFERTDLGGLVLEAVERFQPYADAMKVEIQLNVVPQEFWVRCDKKLIAQVITNLLSNAVKFSVDSNEIFVSITEWEGKVRVSVRDEGIGIADGAYEKIFEAFGQVDSSDTRKFQGSGLGLNISKRIIDAHEGNINYVSALGQGSTFFLELEKWHCQKELA
jgi:signal transduction histidine kinase